MSSLFLFFPRAEWFYITQPRVDTSGHESRASTLSEAALTLQFGIHVLDPLGGILR